MISTMHQINSLFKEKTALFLFFFCLVFYLFAPVSQISDSNYSMMVSQSLIENGTTRLDRYDIQKSEPFSKPGVVSSGYPYQIEVVQDKLHYYFPHGTSVLSAPFVVILNAFGLSAVNEGGEYDSQSEVRIERILAAILISIASVIFYLTSRLSLNKPLSLAVALTGAFATPLLSTASRGMWAHTWLLVLLSSIIFLVWRSIRDKKSPNPILLATLVAWMYFVRPTSSISIIAVSVLVLIYFRPIFITYCLIGLAWLAGFLFYSQYNFGTFLPSYYAAGRIGAETFLVALAGNMISPARGLLIYSPFIFSIIVALMVFRRYVQERSLVFISVAAIVLHWIVISGFPHWWGGHSYGPRFMTDVIPWIILMAIMALQAIGVRRKVNDEWAASGLNSIRAHTIGAVILIAISIFMHVRGAYSHDTSAWNVHPSNIDLHSERLWDWHYPQFLAGLLDPGPISDFPRFKSGEPIYLNDSIADSYLVSGWSGAEPNFRWTEKNVARFGFKSSTGRPIAIALNLAPFVTASHDRQRLRIEANSEFIAEFVLGEQPLSEIRFVIPSLLVKDSNLISLHIPGATSPKVLKISEDGRNLGIAVYSITITEL